MDTNIRKGLKFEAYIEQLFKGCGWKDVERNVIYIKPAGRWFGKRKVAQIDIQVGKKGIISTPDIYELKYSSHSPISLSGRVSSTGVSNAVDQLLRAADIAKCNIGGIVTNAAFSDDIKEYAARRNVNLYDALSLLRMEQRRQSRVFGLLLLHDFVDRFDEIFQFPITFIFFR